MTLLVITIIWLAVESFWVVFDSMKRNHILNSGIDRMIVKAESFKDQFEVF